MKNDLKNNIAFTNARLIDPHSGLDALGDLITEGKQIKAIGKNLFPDGTPENILKINCQGILMKFELMDIF